MEHGLFKHFQNIFTKSNVDDRLLLENTDELANSRSTLNDLYFIFIMYLILHAVGIVIFFIELFWWRFRSNYDNCAAGMLAVFRKQL